MPVHIPVFPHPDGWLGPPPGKGVLGIIQVIALQQHQGKNREHRKPHIDDRDFSFDINPFKILGRTVFQVDQVSRDTFLGSETGIQSIEGRYFDGAAAAVNFQRPLLRPPESDIDADTAEQYEVGSNLRDISTPERIALKDEIEDVVYKAIESLPEDLRTAITLRELEGMSYEDIAHAMDCPVGTVRSRIFRARESIDKKLAPLLD